MLRLHQALNPFIYGFGDKHMRNESVKLICKKITLLSYPVFKCLKKQPRLGTTSLQLNMEAVCNNIIIEAKWKPKILYMDPII